MILSLAWRNLWRRRRRTIASLTAIALTCVIVIFLPALQSGSYGAMIRSANGLLDGYAQIQRRDFLDKPAMRLSFSVNKTVSSAIAELPAGVQVVPRDISYALLSSRKRSLGAQVMGVNAELENRVSTIPGRIISGQYLHADNHIVLGDALARNLQVNLGETVDMLGMARDGSLAVDVLTVAGIFRTGMRELDRQLVQIKLARFDQTFAMQGQRHALVIGSNTDAALLHQAVTTLERSLSGTGLVVHDWKKLQAGVYYSIQLDMVSGIFMYLILIVIVTASLLNNMMMSAMERTREFGMMMALGVKPGLLGRIVWTEIVLMSGLGTLLGMLLGSAITLWYSVNGLHFESVQAVFEQFGMSSTLYPELTPLTLLAGPAVVAGSLILAGLAPVYRLFHLQIIAAMRSV